MKLGEGRDLIAYLEADGRKSRTAEIRLDATSATKWYWLITYDLATASGSAATRQEASDRANERLPKLIAEAAVLAEKAAREDALATLVRRQVQKGDLPISAFDIEASDSGRLQFIIDTVRGGRGMAATIPATVAPLVQAVSDELFRRRVSAQPAPAQPTE